MAVPSYCRVRGFSSSEMAYARRPERQNQWHRRVTAARRQPKDQLVCEDLRFGLDHYPRNQNNQLERSRSKPHLDAGSKMKAENRRQCVRQYLHLECGSLLSLLPPSFGEACFAFFTR
jgi:hypothetical protein